MKRTSVLPTRCVYRAQRSKEQEWTHGGDLLKHPVYWTWLRGPWSPSRCPRPSWEIRVQLVRLPCNPHSYRRRPPEPPFLQPKDSALFDLDFQFQEATDQSAGRSSTELRSPHLSLIYLLFLILVALSFAFSGLRQRRRHRTQTATAHILYTDAPGLREGIRVGVTLRVWLPGALHWQRAWVEDPETRKKKGYR